MLIDYTPYIQYFTKNTWKTFSYLFGYVYRLCKNQEDKIYDTFFYIDTKSATQEIGNSIPGFFKAVSDLESLNMIERKKLETSKNITKYRIKDIAEMKINLDQINSDIDLEKKFNIIEREIRKTKIKTNIKIDQKTTQQLKDLIDDISGDLKNYLNWFISKKVSTKKIDNFNIGIFSTKGMIEEYKNSWSYKKKERAKTLTKQSITKEKMLDDEMLMIALNTARTGRKLNIYEAEVFSNAIREGKIYKTNSEYKLLIEFEEIENLECKNKGSLSQEECLGCWKRKRKAVYLNRVDCQILNIKWLEMLKKLKLKKLKKDLKFNDKKIIRYMREINILDNNKLNEKFIEEIREKYNEE